MKSTIAATAALLVFGAAAAENVEDSDRLLCAAGKIMLCVEDGECFAASALDLDMPQFVVVDTRNKTVSTTKASGQNRSSPIQNVSRFGGRIFLQGIENDRAFSFVIEEDSGILTATVARDGVSISVFGACTDAKVD